MANSKTAYETFGAEIDLQRGYGHEQVDYAKRMFFQEFVGRSMVAAVMMALPDMESRHAAISAAGDTESAADGAAFRTFRFSNGGKAIAVVYPDGERLVYAWENVPAERHDTLRFHIIPFKPEAPADMRDRLAQALAAGATLGDMTALAREYAAFGFVSEDEYADPTLLDEIVATIETKGMTEGAHSAIAAVDLLTFRNTDRVSTRKRLREHVQRIDLVERIAATFSLDHSVEPDDFESEHHFRAVKEGRAAEIYRSVAAMAFESNFVDASPLQEIVELSETLRLGDGALLAYNDTDIHVYAETADDRDIVVHENIDRAEQSVFVTSLIRRDGEPVSIDVHVATSWYAEFEGATGLELDDEATEEGFYALIDFLASRLDRLDEDELVAALKRGGAAPGLAYSYDLASRELEIHPTGYATGYLSYAPHMVEGDLRALREAIAGDTEDTSMTIQRHTRGNRSLDARTDVKLRDHLSSLGMGKPAAPTRGR